MELLETNKFADLHDGKRIFFSHIGMCESVFKEIEQVENDVILITGNDDTPVGKYTGTEKQNAFVRINNIFDNVPKNVKYWFAQNNITAKDNIIPIPLCLRNSFTHFRYEHGCGFEWCAPQHEILKDVYLNDTSIPKNFLYVNYCNRPDHRNSVRKICEEYLGVRYDEATLSYEQYVENILNSECVMCPIGVGVDTYRLYEVLYCKRIPITVKVGKYGVKYCDNDLVSWCDTINAPPQEEEYPIYKELYSKLPVVMLESLEELKDVNHLKKLVEEQKNKKWDTDLLDFNYWKQMIYNLL